MKSKMMKRIAAACGAVMLLGSLCAAQAAGTQVTVENPNAMIYAEGYVDTLFPNEKGVFMPAISYNGSTYIPVRNAGEWMGKQVGWDAATQTVTLSGSAERVFHGKNERVVGSVFQGVGAGPMGGNNTAALRADLSVVLDGVKQSFQNEKGEPVYPLLFQDVTYLPLRSIGELTGLEVSYVPARDGGSACIYLRTPLTDAQKTALTSYAQQLFEETKALEKLEKQLFDDKLWTEQGTAGKTDTVLTGKDEALKIIPQIKAKLQALRAMPAPEGTLLAYTYGELTKELDRDIAVCDDVTARLQKGERVRCASTYEMSEDGVNFIIAAPELWTAAEMRCVVEQNGFVDPFAGEH